MEILFCKPARAVRKLALMSEKYQKTASNPPDRTPPSLFQRTARYFPSLLSNFRVYLNLFAA